MAIINRYKILTFLLLLAGICLLQSAKTYAKTLKSNATTEKVALAFYKTGGVIPNFDRWIKGNAPYNTTPWALREKIYDQEMERLKRAYVNFNPKEDYLIVKTSSFLASQVITDTTGEKTYTTKATFAKAPDALYFPYNFLDERIVLMPYHLEDMMQDEISKAQYDYIKKHTRYKNELKTIIRMKPFKSDFSQPYKIDGIDQWVFKTKIASIELWNKDNNLIWEYTAPWYVSPNILEIKNLYKNLNKKFNLEKGTIKPMDEKF